MKTSLGYRVVSFLSSLSLLIQSFVPLFSAPVLVSAQESLKSDISYSIGNKDFKFGVNNKDAGITTGSLEYQLSYKNDSSANPDQIEVAQGTADLSDSNFEKSIQAATCSTGGTCVVHIAPRGILKVKLPGWTNVKWFSISGEAVTVVNEKQDGVMDTLTDEENNWLLKGDAPAPTATPVTPTPTAEPTVVPNAEPTIVPTAEPTVTVAPTGSVLGATGDEIVQATIVDTQAYVDLSVWTDKADYAPTEKVIVSGKNFTPGYTYTVAISSNDPPVVYATGSVTAASDGTFTYGYQLDGNYRPNYKVEVKDVSGAIVAQVSFTDSESAMQTIENTNCMADQPGKTGLNCTAQDTPTANVSSIDILEYDGHAGCRFPGDTVKFTAHWQIQANANQRYDLGLWFNTKGGTSALNGANQCSVTSLPTTPSPFFDAGGTSKCGDINNSGTGNIAITMIAVCNPDNNGLLRLPYCASWNQNSDNSCQTPIDTLPGSPSKCKCSDGFTLDIPVPPSIQVVKNLVPNTDAGKFDLKINGTTYAASVGNGGDTGKQKVTVGNNEISEIAALGSSLTDYDSSVVCKDKGGLGNVISTTGQNPWIINITNGQDIVCNVSNTRRTGSIELTKIWSGAGGQTTLNIGTTAEAGDIASQQTGLAGSSPLTTSTRTVNAGTYYVSETGGLDNYTSNLTCSDNGTPISVGAANSVYVNSGQSIICTFTNTLKTGNINIVKTAVGGDDTFGFTATGPNGYNSTPSITTISGTGTTGNMTVTAGTGYSVTETSAPTGWEKTSVVCRNAAGAPVANTDFTVANGDTITCTFTNTKLPTLTVNKICNPTDDAGKFNLSIDGTTHATDTGCGGSTRAIVVGIGPHTVSETAGTGTTLSHYDSVIGGDCAANGTITLAAGENKTCTITNTRKLGSLKVTKTVNWNGVVMGDSQKFNICIQGPTYPTANCHEYGYLGGDFTWTNLYPGNYSVTEPVIGTEWSVAITGSPANVPADGGQATATVTNTRKHGSLQVTKTVNWSTVTPDMTQNFEICINGPSTQYTDNCKTAAYNGSILTWSDLIPGTYTVTETALGTNWGTVISSSPVNVPLDGGTAYVTVTNTRQIGTLIVKKVVNNNYGGTLSAKDFTFQVDGGTAIPFEADGQNDMAVNVGKYTITEPAVAGYATTYDNCTDINVTNGGTATCTITNSDIQPKLTVTKIVSNTHGGAKTASDFVLYVDSTQVANGVQNGFNVGSYTVSEGDHAGYTSSIGGDCAADGTVSLALGQTKSCTITNSDIVPQLKLVKSVTNNNGGGAVAGDWTLYATGTGGFEDAGNSVSFHNVQAGVSYSLTESGPGGYDSTGWWTCDAGQASGNTVTLAPGEKATCTIVNDDMAPTLTLVKTVTNDNGGTAKATDWTLTASGPTTISGAGGVVSGPSFVAGTYTLSESTGPAGYAAGNWSCEGGTLRGNTVTIGVGEHATCTIDNNDIAPQLHLRKIVENGNGGSAAATDWTLTATGSAEVRTNLSGTTPVDSGSVFRADTYTLDEYGPSGYTAGDWSCVKNGGEAVLGSTIALGLGDNATCTITNSAQPAKLIVVKHVSNTHGGTMVAGEFTMNVTGTNVSDASFPGDENGTTVTLNAGSYSVDEEKDFGYSKYLGTGCSGTIANGETKTCTITNEDKQGILIVTKHVVGGEKSASDFTMLVTGGNVLPAASFPGYEEGTRVTVNAGEYRVDETDVQGYTKSIGEGCSGTIGVGDIHYCTITNTYNPPPTLTLSKFNTTWPNDTSAGSNVEYHLKVNVDENAMQGIVVTDLMPTGFSYVGGSYHVYRNGIDITGDIAEPVYHSPGKWYLGDAAKGDIFELVYTASIDGGQKPGLYKDLAFAYGCETGAENCSVSNGILATAASSGTSDSGLLGVNTFVGTKVNLSKNQQDSQTVNVAKNEQGEVLGASTSLPSTGTPNYLIIISLILTMLGFIMTVFGLRKKALSYASKVMGLIFAMIVFGTAVSRVHASDSLFIRLAQPQSPTRNNDFTLGYTTMDMVGNAVTVKCFKKGPSDGSFSQFGGDIAVIAGGNNGQCPLGSVVGSNGTYQFYATANSGSGTAVSETISVDYNTSGPGTPSSYGKDKISSCEYRIHFKTADDGKTVKVEIYRSENTSFTADGGTRVSTMGIGPNQDGTYNDTVPDCNKAYYYAVRAFDSAGNGSGVIGDSVTTTTTTTTMTTSGGGALPVSNTSLASGPQEGTVLGVSEEKAQATSSAGKEEGGNVLAAETQPGNGNLLTWIFGHKKISIGILAVALLLFAGVARYVKNRKAVGSG